MTSPYAISLSFGFVSPSNILTAGILLPILAFISVLLRFYVRLSWKQGIGIDDWLLVPALVRGKTKSEGLCKRLIKAV